MTQENVTKALAPNIVHGLVQSTGDYSDAVCKALVEQYKKGQK